MSYRRPRKFCTVATFDVRGANGHAWQWRMHVSILRVRKWESERANDKASKRTSEIAQYSFLRIQLAIVEFRGKFDSSWSFISEWLITK